MVKKTVITQDDINAAARGLTMLTMHPSELLSLAAEFAPLQSFASRGIFAAAMQMFHAKRRMGEE